MIKFCVKSIGLLVVCSFLFASCGKKGCTDSDASNYSTKAKRDDESCRYEGSNVFWVSQSGAQQMVDDGIKSLTVYVEGDIVGQITFAGQNFTAAPACGAANAVTVKMDLFSAKERAFSYRVLDDQSVKRWSATFDMSGNKCTNVELVYFP